CWRHYAAHPRLLYAAPRQRQSDFDETSCRGLRIEHENRMLEEFDRALSTRWHTFGVALEYRGRRRDPTSRLASTIVHATHVRFGESLALTL
ncbi:hypothetical protein, partial [Burkholderia cepacia]|uniref:hypothetical protein n=1 Tax=Burkholderia cepacia TaxID=292 RepID=UPI001C37C28C